MLNSACFSRGEFNMNCCKIAQVSHLLLNIHFFFKPSLLIGNLCELFKVNCPLLIGGLSRVRINQEQIQKCSVGSHRDCICEDQAIWLLSLLQTVDTLHLCPHQPPDGWNEVFSQIRLLGLTFTETTAQTGNSYVRFYIHVMSHELSGLGS